MKVHTHTHRLFRFLKVRRLSLVLLSTLLFGAISLGIFVYAEEIEYFGRKIVGTIGKSHVPGNFETIEGNAGLIQMNPSDGGLTLERTGSTQYLSGWVQSQTVGWIEFHYDPANITGTQKTTTTLLLSGISDENIRQPYYAFTGYAYSPNAGLIYMGPRPSDSKGGVTLATEGEVTFSGYAYSTYLGWINFSGATLSGSLGSGLVGRVKVIGNLGGDSLFDVTYSLGSSFNSQGIASSLNTIRSNLAIALRGKASPFIVSTPAVSDSPYNDILAYSGSSAITLPTTTWYTVKPRTIVAYGSDIIIGSGITEGTQPLAIIALRSPSGSGGNIVIKGNVKQIHATLIAEKSILSGANPNQLYNADKLDVVSALPPNQLYIKGSVISYNTIGGSSNDLDLFKCPWFDSEGCDGLRALKYDLNYFRNFQKTSPEVVNERALPGYDAYSMIIEYDPRVLSAPPPGLAN